VRSVGLLCLHARTLRREVRRRQAPTQKRAACPGELHPPTARAPSAVVGRTGSYLSASRSASATPIERGPSPWTMPDSPPNVPNVPGHGRSMRPRLTRSPAARPFRPCHGIAG
jgi:hypothetical protein